MYGCMVGIPPSWHQRERRRSFLGGGGLDALTRMSDPYFGPIVCLPIWHGPHSGTSKGANRGEVGGETGGETGGRDRVERGGGGRGNRRDRGTEIPYAVVHFEYTFLIVSNICLYVYDL